MSFKTTQIILYEISSITINMSFLKNYLHITLHENNLVHR